MGKSSLTNRLLGQERSIVADMAGTTRDAIDSDFRRNGELYRIMTRLECGGAAKLLKPQSAI